ncbi:MAG: putative lipid II flippase FtsW [Alphaproteobacteria bacterium]|nr:putative lipid II flippase FtsW [Alphaproteobacteria bacterium]
MSLFDRTDSSFLAQWWWTVDRGLLAAFLILVAIGVALIATASPPIAEHLNLWHYHFLVRHLAVLIPALALLLGISTLGHRQVWRVSVVLFSLSALGLVLVLVSGMEIKGARRWIHLPGFSLQPSEFIKPSFLIMAAWLMSQRPRPQEEDARARPRVGGRGTLMAAGLYAMVAALLLLQPDFGMTFTITCGWAAQIFLAGLPLRYLIVLAGAGAGGVVVAYLSFSHVQSRIDRFFNPEIGDNYQVEKSIEAFQNGGFLGTGPGQGTVKMHLPDAHADFIFAVGGEEMGLIFSLILIGVFAFIFLRGFGRLMEAGDMFPLLAGGGLLTMFGLQAFVHMGSSLNILPAKGMTLPFISYGGSSLLSIGFATGAILALTRRQVKTGLSRGAGLLVFPMAGPSNSAGEKQK